MLIAHLLVKDSWPFNISPEMRTLCDKELQNFSLNRNRRLCRITKDHGLVPYLPPTLRPAEFKRFHDGLGHLASSSILPLI